MSLPKAISPPYSIDIPIEIGNSMKSNNTDQQWMTVRCKLISKTMKIIQSMPY